MYGTAPYRSLRGDERGHTLIEAMVALALLTAVIVPTGRLFASLLRSDGTERRVTALLLAQQEMEECLGNADYTNTDKTVKRNNNDWSVKRIISHDGNLVEITVQVLRLPGKTVDMELKTLRSG